MLKHRYVILLLILLASNISKAQVLDQGRKITEKLCSSEFSGRGYVDQGVGKAAAYLSNEFAALKLKPLTKNYLQDYTFSVNTHPTLIQCKVDGQSMQVGKDFLVDAASPAVHGEFLLRHFNYADSMELGLLAKKLAIGFSPQEALVLHNISKRKLLRSDSLGIFKHAIPLILFTEEKKLTHTVSTKIDSIPSLFFFDSLIVLREKIEIDVDHQFYVEYPNQNVVGFIPAKRKDSFIVFTAHFDHLGKQGQAMFPGASDNASGVSMLLNMANYYSKHKPKYPTYFILFSGEEAGLLGSTYFTQHPLFDLKRIKFLINLDIMGNAEQGITVVNGEQHKYYFDLLTKINSNQHLLPEVRIRGKAANSDHYPFSELGVPSIFIYTLGGPGYYHDIYDTYSNLGFKNYEQVFQLLLTFTQSL